MSRTRRRGQGRPPRGETSVPPGGRNQPAGDGDSGQRGSILIEFLAGTLALLLPLVLLAVAAGSVQAARYAAHSAADAAVRAAAAAPTSAEVEARALAAAQTVLDASGTGAASTSLRDFELSIECSHHPCLTPGASLATRVTVSVVAPGLGTVGALPLQVSARAQVTLDRYRQPR
ncbi:MAG: pilus assembly protein TadG-related protein [Promicromonosporaceae bacterium]|nr:pilus assembly protein TadG-related protein [Promicromonosporaceae bacterium]